MLELLCSNILLQVKCVHHLRITFKKTDSCGAVHQVTAEEDTAALSNLVHALNCTDSNKIFFPSMLLRVQQFFMLHAVSAGYIV